MVFSDTVVKLAPSAWTSDSRRRRNARLPARRQSDQSRAQHGIVSRHRRGAPVEIRRGEHHPGVEVVSRALGHPQA